MNGLEIGPASVVHLHKSSRAVAFSPLCQALQARAFQAADRIDVNIPDEAKTQLACTKCYSPRVPGITTEVRIKIGSYKRVSGGLSKRARARRLRKQLPTQEIQRRTRYLVYKCLVCQTLEATDITEKIEKEVQTETPQAAPAASSAKKRAKERKTRSSLKHLVAKNKQRETLGLGLNDFFKPG
jgi:RNase P subunit RPR2